MTSTSARAALTMAGRGRWGLLALLALAVLACGAPATGARASDMAVSISGPGGSPGVDGYFQIYATNKDTNFFGTGGGNATRVMVQATLPAMFGSIYTVAPGWGCGVSGKVVTCSRGGVLIPNQQYDAIYIHATPSTVGHYHTCVQLVVVLGLGMGGGPDHVLGNNTACADGDINPPPPLCLRNGAMPRVFTGPGTAAMPLDADTTAKNAWVSQVMMSGGMAYTDWNKAGLKTSSCTTSGSTTTCTRSANPCR